MTPTLHKPIPMDSRVRIQESFLGEETYGTVIGVSSMHVIFTYIVLLDSPRTADFGTYRAVAVHGTELRVVS